MPLYTPAGTVPAGTISLAELGSDAKADWEYAYSDYKLLNRAGYVNASASVAGTYVLTGQGSGQTLASVAGGQGTFYFDPAFFAAGTRTLKLLTVVALSVNATAPTINFTTGLYPVTAMGGTIGQTAATLGTVTSGSTVLFTTPGASSLNTLTSTDFTAPAAGYYMLGCLTSGTQATNSTVAVEAAILYRQV